MAQRGRPRKVVVEAPTKDEEIVAQFLSERCGILGCNPKFHAEDARDLLGRLSNYKSTNKT